MRTNNHVVAFEVSKHQLAVHELPSDAQCSIANEPKAVRRMLRAKIKEHRSHLDTLLIVCEATGAAWVGAARRQPWP
jgi:hypothetical protein